MRKGGESLRSQEEERNGSGDVMEVGFMAVQFPTLWGTGAAARVPGREDVEDGWPLSSSLSPPVFSSSSSARERARAFLRSSSSSSAYAPA